MQRSAANRGGRKVQPRFWVIISIPIVISFIAFFINSGIEVRGLNALASEKQQQINEARLTQTELERKYAFLQTDQYVEQEARRRFGFIKEGEIRFMIDDDSGVVSGVVSGWQQEIQALGGTTENNE